MPSPAPPAPKSPKRANATIALARAPRACSGAALGYFFIALVCVIWIAASFLVARLEAHGLSPVMLCYICSSGFVVLAPLRWREILEGGRRWALGTRRAPGRAAATGRGGREDGGEPGSSKGESTGVEGGTAKKRVANEGAGSIELVPLASAMQLAVCGWRASSEAQASFGLVVGFSNFGASALNFLADGVAAKVGHYLGSNDASRAAACARAALVCALACGVFAAGALFAARDAAFRALSLDARVDEGSKGDHRSAARRCVTRDAATSADDANDG